MKECIYWANQYGQGFVFQGPLAVKIQKAAKLAGVTPEEFIHEAIRSRIMEAAHVTQYRKKTFPGNWPSDAILNRMRRNKGTRTSK